MRALATWLGMIAAIAVVTAAGSAARLDAATIGFVFLSAVVLVSIEGGRRVGVGASLLATAAYNYFFLPPLYTFHLQDGRSWGTFASFLVTSLMVTGLVGAARHQAAEAERRRAESEANAHIDLLRQSDAFKTSLLRAVSHDLTTPLTAIRIQTESLKRYAAADRALAQAVAAIDDESARLHRRIDNLLTIARLEAGRFTPRPEPTPPADLFRAVGEALPLVFASRPLAVMVAADCPDAYVDPSLALEILANLVENAHRASPEGTPLELGAECVEGRVRLEVRDRGPGLDADSDLPRRGLGLEIARGLTEASGGRLTLFNREGGGAIGRVELPASLLAAPAEEES